MSHTAGVRHYRDDGEFRAALHCEDVAEALELFRADSLEFAPGSRSQYSTYGWTLVSAVVERVAKEPFRQFMRTHVLDPIGLHDTVADDGSSVPSLATHYTRADDGSFRAMPFDLSCRLAGGGYLSTPSDLATFGLSMMTGSLVSPETTALMWTPVELDSGEPTTSGLGWSIRERRGQTLVAHGGRSVGSTAFLLLLPDQGTVVALAANVDDATVLPLAMWLATTLASPTTAE